MEFWRNGIVESQHRAHVCVVNSSGQILFSLGDPDYITFLRSSAKPLQALAVVISGAAQRFNLSSKEIAIISGSHGGEQIHLETVCSILAKAGLSPSQLQCGAHPPLDSAAKEALRQTGERPASLHHNCSGKHAGMMATAVHLGLPIADYLRLEGKVQQNISHVIAAFADVKPGEIVYGIDGCSAPVHGLPMKAAAFAFARLMEPVDLPDDYTSAAVTVTKAMRAHPEMVAASSGRICTELIRAASDANLVAKGGAEGFYSAGWLDQGTGSGVGLSVKIEDGAQRARDPLVIAVLQKFGVLPEEIGKNLQIFAQDLILNHCGKEVGRIKVRI